MNQSPVNAGAVAGALEQFRGAMRDHHIDYAGPLETDGKLHRFRAEGDKGKHSWYVVWANGFVSGAFGCWKRGVNESWHDLQAKLTTADWEAVQRRWKQAGQERGEQEKQFKLTARRTAEWLVQRSQPAEPQFPYLLAKHIQPCNGLLVRQGRLVVPLRDISGHIHSLQFIDAQGGKLFLRNGRVQGCFFTVSDKPEGDLVIVEGLATGISVFEATGKAVIAALNCGNLEAVAKAAREKWPDRTIIIAADNDQWTVKPYNPGLTKATEVAKMIAARLAVPRFKDVDSRPTDFNDLARLEGPSVVAEQINAAHLVPETKEELLERLAKLPPLEYDQQREEAAKKLGVRVTTLDEEIAAKRPKEDKPGLQGCAIKFPSPLPWGEVVDGAAALSEISTIIARYCVLPPGATDAIALWIAHSHAYEAFLCTPRLNIFSPEKGCGKTTTRDVIANFVAKPVATENVSCAVLFRIVDAHKPTLLADEYDSWIHGNDELLGLLNSGHRRGSAVYRCDGDQNDIRGFTAFAPVLLAGIGALPGTLHDRCIRVRLSRAKKGEVKKRYDSRKIEEQTLLCRKLARWTRDHVEALSAADPVLPESAYNRVADNWRPLFAIAELAGADWPKRCEQAFAALTCDEELESQGRGTVLLHDIAAIFKETRVDRMSSNDLCEQLIELEGHPWAELGQMKKPLTKNYLAKLLKVFGISPHGIRVGDSTPKGYLFSDFEDAFARYLENGDSSEGTTATIPADEADNSCALAAQPTEGLLHFENPLATNNDGQGGGVAPPKGVNPLPEGEGPWFEGEEVV